MYLKKKLVLISAFISFIFVISCETVTDHKTDNIIYNKPIVSDSNKKINNIISTDTLEENKDIDKKTLNVGLMLPISGKNYQIGRSLLNSAQLAISKTNNKKIEFSIIDTGNEEEILAKLYELLEQDINIFIGPVFSDKIELIRETINNKNITIISLSNNSKLEDEGLYVFGLTLEDEIDELLNFSYNNNLKKYAVIIPQNEFGMRVKNEFDKFKSNNNLSSFKYTFYETDSPDFYEVSKKISNYEERKLNLEKKIQYLENKNTEEAKKELRNLERLDTYGELNFEAIVIFARNFQEVSNFSSILPYYDVDPKKIQYMGNSIWSKNQALKEPGLANGYFTSLNINTRSKFESSYIEIFNTKPHALATLTYDIVGLISKLHLMESNFTIDMLHASQGFIGVNGWFKILPDGKVKRKPRIYKIKNQNFTLLN
tara:strand:- start:250 stop:1539 length:1290 start_codon:yes stop_codon:yes gene_type:complete